MSNYPNKGVFCRRLREVTAVRVGADNEEQLQQFVLGGEMTPPTTQSRAYFTFYIHKQGVALIRFANEGSWIVTEDGVNFEVMTDVQFRAEYEPK